VIKMILDVIDIGDTVLCDWCNGDYTESAESGGLIFFGEAVCPSCEPDAREGAKKYGEEDGIEVECPKGESFGSWVRRIRQHNKIIIESN
jgi:hypothetical protein